MPATFRALLASYGGGHAEIIAAVARALISRGVAADIIGFTTAYQTFRRAGLPAKPVTTLLLNDAAEQRAREMVRPLIPRPGHAAVSQEETDAYFTLGFRDLADSVGSDDALAQVQAFGRKAFKPAAAMARYLEKTRPDVVVATTSPRFELALLQAARHRGIPSLAIGDLFLVTERKWMLEAPYADHLAVLSDAVADSLDAVARAGTEIHVTGNPAFDTLAPRPDDAARRMRLRRQLGIADETVILWPATPGTNAMTGQPFQSRHAVIAMLEGLCAQNPGMRYVVRPHPNDPFALPDGLIHGALSPSSHSAMDDLLVADRVLVEVSTMGLQAALRRLPVVCVGFADYVLYPRYGLAMVADDLQQAANGLLQPKEPDLSRFSMPPLGSATSNVVQLIERMAGSQQKRTTSQRDEAGS